MKTMSEPRVCIAGATGHLGLAVVEELCARGITVVAVARNAASSNVARLREMDAIVVFVDASDKSQESYTYALVSATTAISCLASPIRHVDESSDFWAIDRDATIRFGCQALTAGVRHLILVSTFEGRESRHISAFSAAKEEAVDALRLECERAQATLTVMRPNAYFKDLTDGAFESVFRKSRHTILGDGKNRINPIAREDVATFMADCIRDGRGGEFLLGGPDIFSMYEIGVLAAQTMGKEEELQTPVIPLWKLRLLAGILSLIGHLSRPARRQAALIHWMLYVSTHDAVAPCWGKRHLRDDYESKFKLYRLKDVQPVVTSKTSTWNPLSGGVAFSVSVVLLSVAVAVLLLRRNDPRPL
jgi:divinyl chlorophyllide a 8-vinyl-reductase